MRRFETVHDPGTATLFVAAGAALALFAAPLEAQDDVIPTDLLIRVVANDAKVIGSGMGGALVTVRNVATGEVLAEGVQEGGTGSTDLIVHEPRTREGTVYDTEGTAGFRATLELGHPTAVEVAAEGPLDHPDAMQRATKTVLMVPGQDVTGEGLVLRLHGFVVRMLDPEPGTTVEPGDPLQVRAHLQMACGCPTEPGGTWDSDRYELSARLLSGGETVDEAPLRFAGETSHFEAELRAPDRFGPDDDLEVEVVASDPERVNFGHDRVRLRPRGDDLGRTRSRP